MQPRHRQPTHLTPRQLQVAECLTDGLCNKEIGARLGISDETVARHLKSAYAAKSVDSRIGLLVTCLREGLVKL